MCVSHHLVSKWRLINDFKFEKTWKNIIIISVPLKMALNGRLFTRTAKSRIMFKTVYDFRHRICMSMIFPTWRNSARSSTSVVLQIMDWKKLCHFILWLLFRFQLIHPNAWFKKKLDWHSFLFKVDSFKFLKFFKQNL